MLDQTISNAVFFFFSSRRRHTRSTRDWSSDVCSSDLSFDEQIRAALDSAATSLREHLEADLRAFAQEVVRASTEERQQAVVAASQAAAVEVRAQAEALVADVRSPAEAQLSEVRAAAQK